MTLSMTLEQIQTYWTVDPTDNEQRIMYTAVANATVIAVAVVNPRTQEWAVYLAGVRGENHDVEWLDVRRHGTIVSRGMAREIFYAIPEELQYSGDL